MQDWIAPDSFPRELTRGQKLLKTVNQRPEDFVLVKEYKNQDPSCFILKDLKSPIRLHSYRYLEFLFMVANQILDFHQKRFLILLIHLETCRNKLEQGN